MRDANHARLRRVLYVIRLNPSKKFGSLEEEILLIARAFRREGSLFLPLYSSPLELENLTEYEAEGLEAKGMNLERFHLASLRRLVRLIRSKGIEIVHWNFTEPLTNPYVWWLSLLTPAVKHVFTDHVSRYLPINNVVPPLKKFVKGSLLRRYRQIIAVSEFIGGCLTEQGIWPNVTCVPHFINTDRFRPDPETRATLRAELDAKDRFVVLLVSHLFKAKGVDVALRAMTEVPEPAVLWIVGDGAEEGLLKQLCHDLGLDPRVRFLGLQRNVEPYMQAADCSLCPVVRGEAAGLGNLEAQACGLPVIASRIGGIPEYVAEGETALLFPAGEPRELARAVSQLMNDPSLRQGMGIAARRFVVEHFSADARRDDHLNLYRDSPSSAASSETTREPSRAVSSSW